MKRSTACLDAKSVLSSADKWGKKYYATSKEGYIVSPIEEGEVFCIIGALQKVCMDVCEASAIGDQLYRLLPKSRNNKHWCLSGWNDDPEREYKDVLELLDRGYEHFKKIENIVVPIKQI